uniref:Uncharacterized protein n=1 Tax=Rhizophora mucronata TaxID=61149 RepID=A0A2P2PK39_RHIMU
MICNYVANEMDSFSQHCGLFVSISLKSFV